MKSIEGISPFDNCPALDGYHCQTNSLAKIFHHQEHPLSEDMLLGLGSGMGFIYWHMKGKPELGFGDYVFIGGRGNTKNFFQDLGQRTGVRILEKTTTSVKKAESALVEKLRHEEPVMVYGDMGFLPWFDLPEGYHFGGHTFVVCGFDGKDECLASDIDQKMSGLKKGFYSSLSLEELRKIRSSPHKPFPPKNAYLEFDFKGFRNPRAKDIYSAIKQTIEAQLNPPIKNIGIKGIRHTAREIMKWPDIFKDKSLRMNLFTLYVFIEIGGTGGGCFRYMYSRFLGESARTTGNKELRKVSATIYESGKMFSEVGLLFKNAEKELDMKEKIQTASKKFEEIADIEEGAFNCLSTSIE